MWCEWTSLVAGPHREVCKDAHVFHPDDAEIVSAELGINVSRSSYDQCRRALDVETLGRLAAKGARWVRMRIRCGDAYFLPAKSAHEFETFAEATTLAWHVHTWRRPIGHDGRGGVDDGGGGGGDGGGDDDGNFDFDFDFDIDHVVVPSEMLSPRKKKKTQKFAV